jgi:hypothetical protein
LLLGEIYTAMTFLVAVPDVRPAGMRAAGVHPALVRRGISRLRVDIPVDDVASERAM